MSSTRTKLIIGQPVHPLHDDDFLAWERKLTAAASRYPGYLGTEVKAPSEFQPDWVIVYEFDSVSHVQNWLNSPTRQHLIDSAADLFDGPATHQVIAQDDETAAPLATVVVTHRIADDEVADFLAWRATISEAESTYPGFRGSELFRPLEGIQDEWTTIYRFDTAEHLSAWLNSPERRKLLADSRFGDYKLHTIGQSFGNWFAFDSADSAPPSDFKTSIAVWLGLYPTVVLLTLLMAPLHIPFWLSMLIGNLLSSFVMSFLIMPHYANPILRWWLAPSARRPLANLQAVALVLGINGLWAVAFYVLTVKDGVHP